MKDFKDYLNKNFKDTPSAPVGEFQLIWNKIQNPSRKKLGPGNKLALILSTAFCLAVVFLVDPMTSTTASSTQTDSVENYSSQNSEDFSWNRFNYSERSYENLDSLFE